MNDKILEDLCDTINSFIKEFRENPYDYLLESDVQAALFAMLRSKVKTHVEVPAASLKTGDKYRMHLIYSEYSHKIDICCLDYDEITTGSGNYIPNKGHDDYIYQLPILLAIELKFIKGERNGDIYGVIRDGNKIKECKDDKRILNSLCICFIQSKKIAEHHLDDDVLHGYKAIPEPDGITDFGVPYVVTREQTFQLLPLKIDAT